MQLLHKKEPLFFLFLLLCGLIPLSSQAQWSQNISPVSIYYNSGNVGIGTGAPNSSLHINRSATMSSISSSAELEIGSTTGYNIVMDSRKIQARNNGSEGILFLQEYGGDLRIHNGSGSSTDIVHIRDNGQVGIGNLSPETQLNVMAGQSVGLGAVGSTTHGYLMLGRSYQPNLVFDQDDIQARDNGSASALNLNPLGGDLYVHGTTTPSLFVQNDGRVGVGVNDIGFDYTFVVEGKIGAREIEVTAGNWADYVFADDYKLLPLEEVEDYIEANNHLPNIPSAAEVESEGLELGAMQVKMMEKIEELTLYMIELNEKVNALEAENAELRSLVPVTSSK